MVELEYYYLDCPLNSMAEYFKTSIENLEESIPKVFHQEIEKEKKRIKQRKTTTHEDLEDEDLEKKTKSKKFCAHADIPQMNVQLSRR